jgi:hypothetical protein
VANGPYYAFPAWAQKFVCATTSNCPRFIVLADWNSEAVLDRETGLVWESSPLFLSGADTGLRLWQSAQIHCNNVVTKGSRRGWRLPTVQELASLHDPSVPFAGRATLPTGHPFQNVASDFYWSATSYANDTSEAWGVHFAVGLVDHFDKSTIRRVWCVRGGQGVDPQ